MRALLTKWSESLLDIPTLIRLGYGGVPSPIVEKEEDDVSSWGGESDLEETDRRTNLSRSRSFTRILNATMRGRSGVALTDEEIDIIQKLSAVGVQRPFERSRSNSMDNTHLTNESGMLRQLGKRSGKTVQKAPRADAIAPLQSNILLASGLQAEPDKPVQLTEESKQIPDETDNDFDLDPSQEEFSELPSSVVAAPDSTLAIARTSRNRDRAQRGVFNKGHRFVASLAQSKTSFHDGLDDDDPIVADASDNSSKKVIRKPVKLSRLGTVIIRPTKKIRLSTPTVHQDTKENSLPRSSTDVGITPNRLVWAEKDDGKIDQTQTHPSIFNSTAYSKNKHHYFTTEETDAVRLGVALFGVGCWKDIQESDSRLKHRTTVQIKDKYRTMVNRGEL